MNFFRKNLFGLAVVSFLALGTILATEAFHHHDALESQTDCSFCAWQQTGSQASSTPSPVPLLFDLLILSLLFTFKPVHFQTFVRFSLGRAPPQKLL